MRTLPPLAQLFVAAVVVAGAALLVMSLQLATFDQVPLLLVLVVVSMITARVKLRLPTTKTRSTLSVSNAVTFTSLLLLGAHPTMVVALAGGWCQSTFGTRTPNPLHKTLFNIASLLLTVQAAGFVYAEMGGTIGAVVWPDIAAPLGAATLAYFLVNCGTVAVVVALSTRQRVGFVFYRDFAWGAPGYFVAAGAAALAAGAIDRSAYAFLPLALTPMYVTYRTYQAYAGRLEDERRHRDIIESLNEGMFVLGNDGRVDVWNDAIERITGIGRTHVLTRELLEAVPALLKTSVPPAIASTLKGGPSAVLPRVEFIVDGSTRILHVRLLPFEGGVTGFVSDITDRTAAEEALRLSEERYALALEGANDGIWDWDLVTDVMFLSARCRAMLGLPPGEGTSRPDEMFAVVHPDDVRPLKAAFSAHFANPSSHFEHEHRVVGCTGEHRWMLARGVAVTDDAGRPVRMAGSLTDITERHLTQEQLQHAASHDTLTALPNRAHFMEMLETALARSKRPTGRFFGALFIDVDRFKSVNDTLGHHVGDQLLVEITKRLQGCLRRGDLTARLGGDEFTMLLNDLRDRGEAVQVASRIQQAFAVPFQLGEHQLFVTVSIGMALSTAGYARAADILRDADVAMYRAKALGGNRQEIFEVHGPAEIGRMDFEHQVRSGLERGEFFLNYQPIVSLATEQPIAFEALLRWKRRDGRTVMPGDFIPRAEESDVINLLGRWVLREACRQLGAWARGIPEARELGMTVNVSPHQLLDPGFVDDVTSAIRDGGIAPGQLRLEITETALMKKPELAAAALTQLRTLGVQTYVDDFGSGYSSLSHLHQLPVNTLKIDRSFIKRLGGEREHQAIVESIVALARNVGADVIAEGVETRDQMSRLRQMGCGYAQGFYFAEPLPADRAEVFVSQASSHPADAMVARYQELSVSVH